MGLNNTPEKRQRRAQKELILKQQLEKPFARDLERHFRTIASDLNESLASTGGIVSSGAYAGSLSNILDVNYRRVQRAFLDEIYDFLRANIRNSSEIIINDLNAIAAALGTTAAFLIRRMRQNNRRDLTAFRQFNVGITTGQVTRTTQREIDRAVNKAVVNLTESLERQPTNAELGRESSRNFMARQRPRSRMIAATETQKAAEGTKQIERDNFLAIRNGAAAAQLELGAVEGNEVWVTQGDSLVRDGDGTPFNHLEADGQIKENGVFNVSNELLRFPGDITLGASAGNVINCRCSAITVIE